MQETIEVKGTIKQNFSVNIMNFLSELEELHFPGDYGRFYAINESTGLLERKDDISRHGSSCWETSVKYDKKMTELFEAIKTIKSFYIENEK